MARGGVGARRETAREAVADVPPVLRRGVGRIGSGRLDRVDRFQRPGDFGPPCDTQQTLSARRDERHGREGLAGADGAKDVEPALDRAVLGNEHGSV